MVICSLSPPSGREATPPLSTEEAGDLECSITKTKTSVSDSDTQVSGGENPPHSPSGVSSVKEALTEGKPNDDWTWSGNCFPKKEEPDSDDKLDVEEDDMHDESEGGTPIIHISRRYLKELDEPRKNCLILKLQG
ncbi:hypothetical protein SLEP1_g18482 [Rubroshorea leprosula]|uniref:Uncharacterized protein n=1 Tax=Rubroshorea leprosula TaxID=152421 RepID=A0AAV5J862_9ROSI|nr:hypothetical protein SLEP1_g18482 [Rubroshorea leprosula]